MSKEWNATLYHQISAPQVSWGKKVLSRVSLRGDETVLDAGCGTGRLTRDLLEALPRGKVVALDVSRNMIDAARAYLADFGDRVEFVACDLLDLRSLELPFKGQFDGIFSTASFHWVHDHEALFAGLFRALRPGGWLCAQCGGAGNIDRFLARVRALMASPEYASYFQSFATPWEFADPETTAIRLTKTGFVAVETGTEAAPTSFSSPEEFQQFVASVILHRHLELLPMDLCQQFLAALTAQSVHAEPPLMLDYVRLNLQARKPK
jgi:trans-aconitate 2-methyltransferase